MILAKVSIERPVLATMLNCVLVVFGLFAISSLPIDQYPNIDFPVITVRVVYPGADPSTIEEQILKPLEEAVNGIAGLNKVSSQAYPSLALLILQFKLEKNGDQANQETRDKIFAHLSDLPKEAETPVIQKFDITGAPILTLSFSSKTKSVGELSLLVKDLVLPKLQRANGVSNVDVSGNRERTIQIYLNRSQMASLNVMPSDIVQSLQQQNLDIPSGQVEEGDVYHSIRLIGTKSKAQAIANLPILLPSGYSRLQIKDVAKILDDVEDEKKAAFIGREPTIVLSVFKQSGSNTTSLSDEVHKTVAKLNQVLPKETKLEIISDNSKFIRGSIDAIKLDLILGALLAVFVVLLFLRDKRATLISAVALPTAVIATFAFLKYMNFTLNMMTTLGLSLSIGILIDDAIVVIENVYRHLSMGKAPKEAAYDATREIGLAVFATTLTICAVFIPVAFMEGIIGRFFYQFGLTVAFAVLVSLWVAFTLTPMLSSRYLKAGHEVHTSGWAYYIEQVLNRIDAMYGRILEWSLEHRFKTLAFGIVIFIASMGLLRFVPVSFFPKEDRGQIEITYTMPENIRLKAAKRRGLEMVDFIKTYPGILRIVTQVGAGTDQKPNAMTLSVDLIDKKDRAFSQNDLMDRLRVDLKPFTKDGSELVVSQGEGGGGGGGRTETIQLVFRSDDYAALVKFTNQVAQFIKTSIAGAVDISTTKAKDRKEYVLHINEEKAADVGLSPTQVALSARTLFEGDKIGEIRNVKGTFDVRMRMEDEDKKNPNDVLGVMVRTNKGERLSLGSLVHIEEGFAPSVINRSDGQKEILVVANYTKKDLQAAMNQIQAYVKQQMPPTITLDLAGEAEIMQDSIKSMLTALLLAIVLIYMVLCAQYEDYLAPFVIMMALPLSLSGAFGALLITGQIMSVYTMIGMILLMGIVTKNGILLIDFTLHKLQNQTPLKQALIEAGTTRLRPILMTTFAAGFGMLPIAIGHGEGGEAKAPMGIAVIGGLLASTFLTLLIVPCLFSLLESLKLYIKQKITAF